MDTGKKDLGKGQGWTVQPNHPLDHTSEQHLDTLKCPTCTQSFQTKLLRINTGAHFPNLKCKTCGAIATSKSWACSCGMAWTKCRVHMLTTYKKEARAEHELSRLKHKIAKVQVDHPLTIKRSNFDPTLDVQMVNEPMHCMALPPGSRLANRFPQHVKNGFTDQRVNRCRGRRLQMAQAT